MDGSSSDPRRTSTPGVNINESDGSLSWKVVAASVGAMMLFSPVMAPGEALASTPADAEEAVTAFESVANFRGIAPQQLPEDLSEGLELGDIAVRLSNSTAHVNGDGFVDFGTTSAGVRILATSDGARMDRFGILIDDSDAPEHYEFDVELPEGAKITNAESGAVSVTTESGTTVLPPATAVDADGQQIPARYRIAADKLMVDVELQGAALPVLVDPVSTSHGWGFREWYSRGDVRR